MTKFFIVCSLFCGAFSCKTYDINCRLNYTAEVINKYVNNITYVREKYFDNHESVLQNSGVLFLHAPVNKTKFENITNISATNHYHPAIMPPLPSLPPDTQPHTEPTLATVILAFVSDQFSKAVAYIDTIKNMIGSNISAGVNGDGVGAGGSDDGGGGFGEDGGSSSGDGEKMNKHEIDTKTKTPQLTSMTFFDTLSIEDEKSEIIAHVDDSHSFESVHESPAPLFDYPFEYIPYESQGSDLRLFKNGKYQNEKKMEKKTEKKKLKLYWDNFLKWQRKFFEIPIYVMSTDFFTHSETSHEQKYYESEDIGREGLGKDITIFDATQEPLPPPSPCPGNPPLDSDESLFSRAIDQGNPEILHSLLENEANSDEILLDGSNLLIHALDYGDSRMTRDLLEHGANPNKNTSDHSPLGAAIANGNSLIVHELLQYGADPNQKLQDDTTPLGASIQTESLKMVHDLLEHGANPNENLKDETSHLLNAISTGDTSITHELLKYGANPNMKDTFDNSSVLVNVIERGNRITTRNLLEHGANPNLNNKLYGENALTIALYEKHLKLVDDLLEYGANSNEKNSFGISPLVIAIDQGDELRVRSLLEYGANPNEYTSPFEMSVLMMAVNKMNSVIVHDLLRYGADPNKKDSSDFSPVINAIENSDVVTVHCLLKYGANPNMKDPFNFSPLTIAKFYKIPEIIEYLEDYGAIE